MLDIYARQSAGLFPIIRSAEFCRIELAPRNDGLFVSLTATVVDDQEPQLLDHEVTSEHVTMRWPRLFEQKIRVAKWIVGRG